MLQVALQKLPPPPRTIMLQVSLRSEYGPAFLSVEKFMPMPGWRFFCWDATSSAVGERGGRLSLELLCDSWCAQLGSSNLIDPKPLIPNLFGPKNR